MSNSHFYQKNKSMMPHTNPNPIKIETNENNNIMFVPQKSNEPIYLCGNQPSNLLGATLIPVMSGSDKYLTATEKNLQIIDEVKRELEKNQNSSSTIISIQEKYSKDKTIQKCDLHPKQLSDKCRKCKEIRNTIIRIQDEKEKQGKNIEKDNLAKISSGKSENPDAIKEQNTVGEVDNIFKIYGDPLTGNLNPLIFNNILSCQYFKEDVAFKGFNEILAEIIQNVTYAEPWAVGISGVPSTLYCCLYKLILLKLTESQINYMINCRESPYIRCCGLLYIRYLSEPQELWNRLSKYIFDEEKFSPSANAKYKITIGEYVEILLREYDYYGTRLPKIPTQIEREIKAKLILTDEKRARKRKNEENLHLFIPNSLGSAVSFQDNKWHEAIILSVLNNRQVYVKFSNGSDDLMNMLENYKTENKRENYEILKATYYQLLENYKDNNLKVPFFTSEEIIDLGDIELIQVERKIEKRDEPMDDEKDKKHRKEKITKRDGDDSISSSLSRRNRKDKKRRRKRHKSSSSSSSSSSSRSRDEQDRYSNRHHRDKHHKKSDRHRSKRSRSRSRSKSISSRSKSSEYHKTKALKINQEKSVEEDQKKIREKILEKEREAALAKGRDYAIKPTSYKSALFAKLPGLSRRRSKSPSPLKQNIQTIEMKKEKKEEEAKPKKEYSKEFIERQENLRKKYGQAQSSSSSITSQKLKANKDDLGPEIMKLG